MTVFWLIVVANAGWGRQCFDLCGMSWLTRLPCTGNTLTLELSKFCISIAACSLLWSHCFTRDNFENSMLAMMSLHESMSMSLHMCTCLLHPTCCSFGSQSVPAILDPAWTKLWSFRSWNLQILMTGWLVAPRLDFLWISSLWCDSRWICVDFMDLGMLWGRKLGSLWQPVGAD